MSFSTSLGTLAGYNAAVKRIDDGLTMSKNAGRFLQKFADLQTSYSKRLTTVTKDDAKSKMKKFGRDLRTGTKSGRFVFGGSTHVAWTQVSDLYQATYANAHQQYAESIASRVAGTLVDATKERETQRKSLVDQGNRIVKDLQTAETIHFQKKKAYYDAMSKQAPNTDTAEQEYREAIEVLNNQRHSLTDGEMPNVLESLEQLERGRIQELANAIHSLSEVISELPAGLESVMSAIATAVANANENADVEAFCKSASTGFSRPAETFFVPWQEGESAGGGAAGGAGAKVKSLLGRGKKPHIYGHPPVALEGDNVDEDGEVTAVLVAGNGDNAPEIPSGKGGTVEVFEISPDNPMRAKALFDYEAQDDTEISLKDGEAVVVVAKDDESGWWTIRTDSGEEKFVPGNYVKVTGPM